MKKLLLFTMIMLLTVSTFATQITIKVVDFQFKPKSVNAKVGDTILFKWVSGIHTTTAISIPAGAATWDKLMDSAHKKFKYVLKVAGTYNYNCTYHAPLMKGSITVSAALTSGFASLDVNESYGKALLNWTTKSSKDIASFSVQRSTDGENFTEIARINPATGNNYKYADNSPLDSKYAYYQVKVTDKEGNTELTDIKMFTSKSVVQKLITSLGPNPVTTGHLMLQFNADSDGLMLVQLYNTKGQLVKQTEMSAMKGINNGHFHLGDLPPGTYYLHCSLGNLYEKHAIILR